MTVTHWKLKIILNITFPWLQWGYQYEAHGFWDVYGKQSAFLLCAFHLTVVLEESVSKGSADVDEGCRILAWAPHSSELANKAASACSPASLPPSPAIWHPPLAVQKYLKLFCSQSVPGLLFLMLSESTLQRHSLYLAQRFPLFTHMLSCLQYKSWLLYPELLLSWTFFFFLHSILSRIFCLCVSFISTHSLCIPNLSISFRFLHFFHCHLSFLLSSHPHCTFFLKYLHLSTSVSQFQSCSSPTFPEEAIYKDYRVFFHTNISAAVRLHHAVL